LAQSYYPSKLEKANKNGKRQKEKKEKSKERAKKRNLKFSYDPSGTFHINPPTFDIFKEKDFFPSLLYVFQASSLISSLLYCSSNFLFYYFLNYLS